MFNKDITQIPRVRLKLFDLKAKDALIEVYNLYQRFLKPFYSDTSNKHFNYISCPICLGNDHTLHLSLDDISYHTCSHCGSVYTPKMLKDDILKEMYETGTYQQYFQKLVLPGQSIRKNTLELRKCKQISALFDKPGTLLDIGCGSGSFLKTCQEHGWKVQGIDPSQSAVENARTEYGLEVYQGTIDTFDTNDRFDCITIVGVIEHLTNPVLCLKQAERLLKPGGVIFYEVPSADCFLLNYLKHFPFSATRYIEAGRHYLFFSSKTINFICNQLRMELVHLESNGLDIETIIFRDDLDPSLTDQLLSLQETLNAMGLSDHYRIFMRKPK
jgi:SAM-dependent methyltransferase